MGEGHLGSSRQMPDGNAQQAAVVVPPMNVHRFVQRRPRASQSRRQFSLGSTASHELSCGFGGEQWFARHSIPVEQGAQATPPTPQDASDSVLPTKQ